MRIVTSGRSFLDIDAFASCIAYVELLNLTGTSSLFVSGAPLNYSIPSSIREWDAPINRHYDPKSADRFTVIDVSDPKWFDEIVEVDKVDEIIDHHSGFEGYWLEQKVTADIDYIGSSSTQIYERWVRAGRIENISELSAQLLLCGILDNTLKLSSAVTTDRDQQAYADLMMLCELPLDWPQRYFSECQKMVERNFSAALSGDRKVMSFPGYDEPIEISQVSVWDASQLVQVSHDSLKNYTGDHPYMINLVSIAEGRSYVITSDPIVQAFFSSIIDAKFSGDIAHTDRLWLRKEMMKTAILNFQKEGQLYVS